MPGHFRGPPATSGYQLLAKWTDEWKNEDSILAEQLCHFAALLFLTVEGKASCIRNYQEKNRGSFPEEI